MSATWVPRPAGRHSTAPAAMISAAASLSGIRAPAAPRLDQQVLQVGQRDAGRFQVMARPDAVAGQPPGRGAVRHGEVDELAQLRLLLVISDPYQSLDPAVQIPVH